MIVRYPAAKDDPAVVTDGLSPLSGVFHNYLGAIIEAILGELGPLVLGAYNLKTFLGSELSSRLSNWNAHVTPYGNEKGAVFGIIKKQETRTATNWNGTGALVATTRQGVHPSGKTPAIFTQILQMGPDVNTTPTMIAGGVRGYVSGVTSTTFTANLRGVHTAGSDPTGASTFTCEVLYFFMVEA